MQHYNVHRVLTVNNQRTQEVSETGNHFSPVLLPSSLSAHLDGALTPRRRPWLGLVNIGHPIPSAGKWLKNIHLLDECCYFKAFNVFLTYRLKKRLLVLRKHFSESFGPKEKPNFYSGIKFEEQEAKISANYCRIGLHCENFISGGQMMSSGFEVNFFSLTLSPRESGV